MDALPWFWIWVVLAALLCIGEMISLSFFMLPFAIGAAAAAILYAFGVDLLIQWIVFVLVSVAALVALRPVANRITRNTGVKSGVERLIGSIGEVIEGNPPEGLIRIRVEREEWNASVEGGATARARLSIGANVEVLAIDGTRLVVREIIEPSPEAENLS
ncbi:MAG: NfeD family protein [Coriobacteriia bacterium]|nr:NfeD family protein [Coriobacteriia bacterium]